MTSPHRTLFPSLDPPPGGLVALRARLAQDRRRAPLAWRAGAAALVCVLLFVFAWRLHPPHTLRDELVQRDYPGMVALGLSAAPAEPVTLLPSPDGSRALRRVPLPGDSVVVYVVESRRR